jgi:hypothetical protein
MIMFERDRIRPYLIRYMPCVYIFFESLRNTSKGLESFIDKSYVVSWD